MKLERRNNANRRRRRRAGVTLVEMLVTLAVLLMMMALIVQIFQAATGAMNDAQIYQSLDDDLRRVDSTLRGDLAGATARFTPPLDPKDNLGYFEYVENDYADNDGEDCDDSIRFTAKAPPGRPFTGRMWAKPPKMSQGTTPDAPFTTTLGDMGPNYFKNQPVTVTSEYAEIIYFLRNGNLYRRVLLVAPELQSSVVNTVANQGFYPTWVGGVPAPTDGPYPFTPGALGSLPTSWLGVNDLSARPAARGLSGMNHNQSVVLNTLGDLTDRHNRAFSPRFADDFVDPTGGNLNPDGIPDDLNADNVPDLYPSLYYNLVNDTVTGNGTTNHLWNVSDPTSITSILTAGMQTLTFPNVYRGAFSQAQNLGGATGIGWIHAPAPYATDGTNLYAFNSDPVNYVKFLNQNPLDLGDNLPAPYNTAESNSSNLQTYWGYPTWRETLAPEWMDPTVQVNQPVGGFTHPFGMAPINPGEIANGFLNSAGTQLLPPMSAAAGWRPGTNQAQLFCDGAGAATTFFSTTPALWTAQSWEDDLVLTNVRSFDVKAFEPALADYADLGWGDDPRISSAADPSGNYLGNTIVTPYLVGNMDAVTGNYYQANAYALIHARPYDVVKQTFAHEGRMPPLRADGRFDAQFGFQQYVPTQPFLSRVGDYSAYDGNVGDDATNIVRMRRVWDSWSTTYSKAPATGSLSGTGAGAGFPYGPPFSPPIYPSYPAPYPAPLRGIQIQIRVVDPAGQHVKVLTIRQDFTDKL